VQAAIKGFCQLVEATSRKHQPNEWGAVQANLGAAYFVAFESSGDIAVLKTAIIAYKRALKALSPNSPGGLWSTVQMSLGDALLTLGQITADLTQTAAAIRPYERALETLPRTQTADWAKIQINLGGALFKVGEQADGVTTLQRAVKAHRAILSVLSRDDHPAEWLTSRRRLGQILLLIGRRSQDSEVLRQAADVFRTTLGELMNDAHPMDRTGLQIDLGNTLLTIGEMRSDISAVTEAAAVYRQALASLRASKHRLTLAYTRMNLGSALRLIGEASNDPGSLRTAIVMYRHALAVFEAMPGEPGYGQVQVNLGNVLRILCEVTGKTDSVREALSLYRTGSRRLRQAGRRQEWALARMNHATALLRLAEMEGQRTVLRAAVVAYRSALTIWPSSQSSYHWAICRMNLGTALSKLGEISADATNIELAIEAFKSALDALPPVPDRFFDRAKAFMNLANAIRCLAEMTGDQASLREALTAYRTAVSLLSTGQSAGELARARLNLAIGLLTLGEMTGDLGAVREAIGLHRLALESRPLSEVPVGWAKIQINLGNNLTRLAEYVGDVDIAQEAVVVCGLAVEKFRQKQLSVDLATGRANLGSALLALGTLSGKRRVLKQAVRTFRLAIDSLPTSQPINLATTWMNLGAALYALGSSFEDAEVMASAVASHRQALQLHDRERHFSGRVVAMGNLSQALGALAMLTSRLDLSREAVAISTSAFETLAIARSPLSWARAGANLGSALYGRSILSDEPGHWAALIKHDSCFLEQLGNLAWTSSSVGEQTLWAERVAGSASRLTVAHMRLACPEAAMMAAQLGLAVQLAIGLQLSGDQDTHVDEKLKQARADWRLACAAAGYAEAALAKTSESKVLTRLLARQIDSRRHVENTFAVLREAISAAGLAVPQPMSIPKLRASIPSGGALVLLVPGPTGTIMFVLGAHEQSEAPLHFRVAERANESALGGLLGNIPGSFDRPRQRGASWLGAYMRFRDAVRPDGTVSEQDIAEWNSVIEDRLGRLWRMLMGPLDDFLRSRLGLRPRAPVALIHSGALSFFPLHAARHRVRRRWRYFLEEWEVSYAPSPAAWRTCRERSMSAQRNGTRLLAVTAAEGDNPALASFCAHDTKIFGKRATSAAVLAALPEANYISLYCHGVWNPIDPASSYLMLDRPPRGIADPVETDHFIGHPERIAVGELRRSDLGSSRLALLWACESAMIGLRHRTEATGFPAALVESGVPGVIASLWVVETNATIALASTMLSAHLKQGLSPAGALRAAQIAMLGADDRDFRSAAGRNAVLALPVQSLQTLGGIGLPFLPDLGPSAALSPSAPFFWAGFTLTGA
jgi:tetratricopeptide (TPR) repeat protein